MRKCRCRAWPRASPFPPQITADARIIRPVTHLLRLFPAPQEEVPLAGTYLAQRLHLRGSEAAPFVYANFVASLDGRIALKDPSGGPGRVPDSIISGNDFRLLLELEAQADCLVTHAGYLREIAAGRLDDILTVGAPEGSGDLARWRAAEGLAPQPAVAIASASLDFSLPPSLAGRRVIVATGAEAPRARRAALQEAGCEVILAGAGRGVEGAALTDALGARGFRNLFLLAGPRMLDTMLRGRVLARLYVTIAHRLLGGEAIHTMLAGPALGPEGRLRLGALYYDPTAPDGAGQFFAQFEPADAAS
jgi:riboflavin biosynthesis pyrimidine reductase